MTLFLKRFMVEHVQKLVELMIIFNVTFLLQLVSFTVDGDPL